MRHSSFGQCPIFCLNGPALQVASRLAARTIRAFAAPSATATGGQQQQQQLKGGKEGQGQAGEQQVVMQQLGSSARV